MWAHAVRRICAALSVLAKPMKLSRSGRKGDRFQQQSWRLWSFRRGFFLMTIEHVLPLQTVQPELCRKRLNGMWSQIIFFNWKCLLWPCCVTEFYLLTACLTHKWSFTFQTQTLSCQQLLSPTSRNSIEKVWFLKRASWQAKTSSKVPANTAAKC